MAVSRSRTQHLSVPGLQPVEIVKPAPVRLSAEVQSVIVQAAEAGQARRSEARRRAQSTSDARSSRSQSSRATATRSRRADSSPRRSAGGRARTVGAVRQQRQRTSTELYRESLDIPKIFLRLTRLDSSELFGEDDIGQSLSTVSTTVPNTPTMARDSMEDLSFDLEEDEDEDDLPDLKTDAEPAASYVGDYLVSIGELDILSLRSDNDDDDDESEVVVLSDKAAEAMQQAAEMAAGAAAAVASASEESFVRVLSSGLDLGLDLMADLMGDLESPTVAKRGSVGNTKKCTLCCSAYEGYGTKCGDCRRKKSTSSSQQCTVCGDYFSGFVSVCWVCS